MLGIYYERHQTYPNLGWYQLAAVLCLRLQVTEIFVSIVN
jgi:hypothetical protein